VPQARLHIAAQTVARRIVCCDLLAAPQHERDIGEPKSPIKQSLCTAQKNFAGEFLLASSAALRAFHAKGDA
jgi:hypothetical protein